MNPLLYLALPVVWYVITEWNDSGKKPSETIREQLARAKGGGTLFARVVRWKSLVEEACSKYRNVPKSLVYATIQHESGGNPKARSNFNRPPYHAYGLMQLLPSTAKNMGVNYTDPEIYEPRSNIFGGVRLLSESLTRYKGDIGRVLAAYYGGPGNAKRPFKPGIEKYVQKSLALMKQYEGV